MYLPDIIKEKINWYLWKGKINEINDEYKEKIGIWPDQSIYDNCCYIDGFEFAYNFRNLSLTDERLYYTDICNYYKWIRRDFRKVDILPKNYYYQKIIKEIK